MTIRSLSVIGKVTEVFGNAILVDFLLARAETQNHYSTEQVIILIMNIAVIIQLSSFL